MNTSRQAASSRSGEGHAQTVLVIDDEPSIRAALKRYFARQGVDVDEANDGAMALEKLLGVRPRDYDAIICDLRLPGVSGMEVYRRLAAERPALALRVVFSTGDAVSPDVRDFLRHSGRPVVEKPFALDELGRTVERLASA